jgi:PPOX class probable F420-dependent enzyme
VLSGEKNPFDTLTPYRYINLSTFRRNGKPVGSTVLFALENGKMYVTTGVDSWKVKRIRNNPNVKAEPCSASGQILGSSVSGVARVMSADESEVARRALLGRNRLERRLFNFTTRLMGVKRVYLEITPAP